jgi:hypothetical protein
MENMVICQSCAMPMAEESLFGTNEDGSKNEDYCTYCFKDGKFTAEISMDEMVEECVPHVSKNNPWPDEETARKAMKEMFPQLKRWK